MRKHSLVFNLTIKDLRDLGIIKGKRKESKCVYDNKMIQPQSFQTPSFINRYSTETSLSNIKSQYIQPHDNLKNDNIDVPSTSSSLMENSYQLVPEATPTTPVDTSVFETPVDLPLVKPEQPKVNITTELTEIPPPAKKIRITIPLSTYINRYKQLGGNDPAILENKKQTAKMYKLAIVELENKK